MSTYSSGDGWVTVDSTGTLSPSSNSLGVTSGSGSLIAQSTYPGASSTQFTYTTPMYTSGYMSIDILDQIINGVFSTEEQQEWLRENGFEETEFEKFLEYAKARFRSILLAPKQELKIKIPKID